MPAKKESKQAEKLQKPRAHVIKLGQWYPINKQREIAIGTTDTFFNEGEQTMDLWLAPDQLPLTLRQWEKDDVLRLKNGGHQKVKRVLIDQKVHQQERKQQLVLVDATGAVIWLLDHKWSWFDRPQDYQSKWRRLVIGIKDKEKGK